MRQWLRLIILKKKLKFFKYILFLKNFVIIIFFIVFNICKLEKNISLLFLFNKLKKKEKINIQNKERERDKYTISIDIDF